MMKRTPYIATLLILLLLSNGLFASVQMSVQMSGAVSVVDAEPVGCHTVIDTVDEAESLHDCCDGDCRQCGHSSVLLPLLVSMVTQQDSVYLDAISHSVLPANQSLPFRPPII